MPGLLVAFAGLVILAAGMVYAVRLRSSGGVSVRSRPWYTAVIVSSVGSALIAVGLVSVFYP